MKTLVPNRILLVGFVFCILAACSAQSQSQNKGTLTIEVTGLEDNVGQVGVTIFRSKTGFPSDATQSYKSAFKKSENNEAVFEFKDLPHGTYAVATLHDANNNKKLDKNFLGIPKEGFGVSNNPKIYFSAPSFKDCKFELNVSKKSITIRTKYF